MKGSVCSIFNGSYQSHQLLSPERNGLTLVNVNALGAVLKLALGGSAELNVVISRWLVITRVFADLLIYGYRRSFRAIELKDNHLFMIGDLQELGSEFS